MSPLINGTQRNPVSFPSIRQAKQQAARTRNVVWAKIPGLMLLEINPSGTLMRHPRTEGYKK